MKLTEIKEKPLEDLEEEDVKEIVKRILSAEQNQLPAAKFSSFI